MFAVACDFALKGATQEELSYVRSIIEENYEKNKDAGGFLPGEGHGSPAKVKEVSAELFKLAKLEQKPSTWSEEDEQYLLVCKNALAKYQTTDKWDACIISHWLENKRKSLKERVQPQPKQEWSEEDEDVINHLLAICAGAKRYRQFAGCLQEDITKYQTWLKSLRPQNHWKPSEEQMGALFEAHKQMSAVYHMPLITLYNDLKKLQQNRI